MLFAVEGDGVLDTDDGRVAFGAGSLAFYRANCAVLDEPTVGLVSPCLPSSRSGIPASSVT